MSYDMVLRTLTTSAWLMHEPNLRSMTEILLKRVANGAPFPEDQVQTALDGAKPDTQRSALRPQIIGEAALITIAGIITRRASHFDRTSGLCSCQMIKGQFAEAKDSGAKAVLAEFDTPGGDAMGVAEAGQLIREMREEIPIVGVASGMAASAGYWLLSQCSEIVVSPSSEVGSIGVFTVHLDLSEKDKAEGRNYTLVKAGEFKGEALDIKPLSEDAEAELQRHVNMIYSMFLADVARGRGVTAAKVKSDFGRGRLLRAREAVAAGMADREATLEATLKRLQSGPGRASVGRNRAFSRRQFEAGLRETFGLSRRQAETLASHGFPRDEQSLEAFFADQATPRDEAVAPESAQAGQDLAASLRQLAANIRGKAAD